MNDVQPSAAPTWREVAIGGRTCRISGEPDDIYFRGIADAARSLDKLAVIARAVLPEDGVALDVGANIGLSALAMAPAAPRGRILAFEPVPTAFARLTDNVAADPLGNIEPVPTAIGAAAGTVALHIGPRFSAGSHVVPPTHTLTSLLPVTEVPITTLDSVVAERGLDRLDLVKIDVEGFEAEVLDGAQQSLARFRPLVHLEMNSFCLVAFRNMNPRVFVELLMSRFPHVIWFRPDGTAHRIRPGHALHHFIHDHLVRHASVNDLVCCFDDTWLKRMPGPA